MRAWEQALRTGSQVPLISNTDQGAQFTSSAYIDAVESAGVEVSMDGRGRWLDNRFVERLWRSAKYEEIYLADYGDGLSAERGLGTFNPFTFMTPSCDPFMTKVCVQLRTTAIIPGEPHCYTTSIG